MALPQHQVTGDDRTVRGADRDSTWADAHRDRQWLEWRGSLLDT